MGSIYKKNDRDAKLTVLYKEVTSLKNVRFLVMVYLKRYYELTTGTKKLVRALYRCLVNFKE